jgi:hypothetical protein
MGVLNVQWGNAENTLFEGSSSVDGVDFYDQFMSNPRSSDHLSLPSPTRGRTVVMEGGPLDI